MSIWHPEPGDPWYIEQEEDAPAWSWQRIVTDALILMIVFMFIAFVAFTLGYFNVF